MKRIVKEFYEITLNDFLMEVSGKGRTVNVSSEECKLKYARVSLHINVTGETLEKLTFEHGSRSIGGILHYEINYIYRILYDMELDLFIIEFKNGMSPINVKLN
ncbi:hypothetical protein AALC75_22530 [Lachnospiraceae bacterium 48-42]